MLLADKHKIRFENYRQRAAGNFFLKIITCRSNSPQVPEFSATEAVYSHGFIADAP
jgi:hypothetical protein